VQVLRVDFTATDDKESNAHFELHWKSYGERFNCIAPCDAGWRYVDSTCIPCNTGTFSSIPGFSSTCTLCSAGTFKEVAGPGECTSCAAGSYSNIAGMTNCVLCSAGTFHLGVGRASVCPQCTTGKYKESSGAGACTPCPRGEYSTETGAVSKIGCVKCGDATYPTSVGSSCEPCATRYDASVLTSAFYGNAEMPGCIQFVQ
jgi:hypothetical protein